MNERVRYFGVDTAVQLGDHVVIRRWFRSISARITYVPGISQKNDDMEFNGLTWVCVQIPGGTRYGVVVDPTTSELKKNVSFVKRGTTDIAFIGPDGPVFE
jgi:hypothetical protein